MTNHPPKRSFGRKLLRFLLITVLVLIALAGLLLFALSLPPVQQRLTDEAESWLQGKLKTRVEIGSIRLKFPYSLSLDQFLLEDQHGDTLARIGSLVVNMDMWKLLDQTIELQKITLENATVRLNTRDSINNYDFIAAAFANPDTMRVKPVDTTASPWQLRLDLATLSLKSVDFSLQDDDAASSTIAQIGELHAVIGTADLKTMHFRLDDFFIRDSRIRLVETRPPSDSGKPSPAFAIQLDKGVVERTQFYYSTPERLVDATLQTAQLTGLTVQSIDDRSIVMLEKLALQNSALTYRDPENVATPGHFNGSDLALQNLNADVTGFSMQNDTLSVQANALSGTDKSGLAIYELHGNLQVTPNSITARDAKLRANQTTLDGDIVLFKNDQATFDRMQITLREVRGIIGDLIVFLPPQENPALARLRDMPYTASGNLDGTLQNLRFTDLRATAGKGTVVNLNGSVQNLDNTERLGFDLRVGQFRTVRPDLLRFMTLGDTPLDSALQTPLPAWISTNGTLRGSLAAMQVDLNGEAGVLQVGNPSPILSPSGEGGSTELRDWTSPFGGRQERGEQAPLPFGGGVDTRARTVAPLRFALSGALTQVNDPDRLGMDLTIEKLEATQPFFAYLEPRGIVTPDLLTVNGTLRGALADLNTKLEINALRNGATSRLSLNGALRNLNHAENLGMDISFGGELTRAEILGYVPDSVITKVLNLPPVVYVAGKAKGTMDNLEANAAFRLGDLGTVMLQGTLRDSVYVAEIVGENLRVGRLAADTSLRAIQTVGLLINVEGEGFDVWNTSHLKATGQFDSLIYNNLILREIVFDVALDGKRFNGGLRSPDARAAINARVSGDFTTAIPVLETDVTINCMDLREFGWAYRPTIICLRMLSHSEGLSLDTLNAKITLENIDLQYDTVHVRPGNLTLDLSLDHRNNRLAITSEWLEGELKGYFSLVDLPATLNNIAEQYFIVDRSSYVRPMGTDSLSIELRLLQPQLLTTGLIPGLIDLGTLNLRGSLNARTNFFDLTANLTRLHYLEWELDSLNARAYAGDSAALFFVSVPLIRNQGEFFVKNAGINGHFVANRATATLAAKDREDRDRFLVSVQAQLLPNRGGVVATLGERLILDYQNWTVAGDNRIESTKSGVKVQNLVMHGDGGQSVQIEGTMQQQNNGKTGLDFKVEIERLSYDNFAIFVANTLRDLKGWAEAHLDIKGTTEAPQVRGTLQLHETEFTPALTNVNYKLSETPLEITPDGVTLDGLTLRDPFDQELKIDGRLNTKDWTNITTNLAITADEFQVLNTTRQQNGTYFGRLFVSVNGRVRGPLTAPKVTASVRTAKKSEFTYVYDAATQNAQHEGIVVFLQPQRQYVRPPVYDAPVLETGLTLSASIEIDSNLNISTVVNPITGDDFKGAANGRLQLDIFPNGNMTLSGRVDLVRGVYNYSYQSVVKRSFQVAPGSNIIWSGDVANPELNLIARYEFRASPYPLVVSQLASATPEETSQYRRAQIFFLQTNIAGTPREPNVGFKFIYPSDQGNQGLAGSFGNQDAGLVSSAIGSVNTDPNLLSRQVFGVLLLRSFISESAGPTTTVSGDPLREGLTSFLTTQVNALAAQYLTFIDISVEAKDASTNSGTSQAEGTTQYELRLQKSFFDDRLTFKLSGGTTVNAEGDAGQSGLENASVEYSVTRNGGIKVTVFSEKGFELLNASGANLRNSGAGILLTKEFNGSRKRRKNQN